MIFTREQWFEVWKQYTYGYAKGEFMKDPDRPLRSNAEYCSEEAIQRALQMDEIKKAILEKDGLEAGIHPTWVGVWMKTNPLSIIWVMLWAKHELDQGTSNWSKPR